MNKQAVLRGKWGPRSLYEVRKVAGPAKYKQSKTVSVVFIQLWIQRELNYLVCYYLVRQTSTVPSPLSLSP